MQSRALVVLSYGSKTAAPIATHLYPTTGEGTLLLPGVWYSVVLTHEHRVMGGSTVSIVLNDQLQLHQPLKYPNVKDSKGTLYIGTDALGRPRSSRARPQAAAACPLTSPPPAACVISSYKRL